MNSKESGFKFKKAPTCVGRPRPNFRAAEKREADGSRSAGTQAAHAKKALLCYTRRAVSCLGKVTLHPEPTSHILM